MLLGGIYQQDSQVLVGPMIRQAEQIVILTESEKFARHGIVPLNLGDYPRIVITDKQIPGEITDELKHSQIELITI